MFRPWLRRWAWMGLGWIGGRFGIAAVVGIGLAGASILSLPAHAEWQAIEPAAPDLAATSLRMGRVQALIPDWRQRCVDIRGGKAFTPEQEAVQQVASTLGRSELGAWLIDQAAYRSVLVCLDKQTDLEAYYRAHLNLIGLNAKLSPAGRLVFLAHELAHVTQHPRFSNNRRFSPENMLLLHRVREATAEAVATRVLWQLRDLGLEQPWQAKLETAYGDIAGLFEASMAKGRGAAAELRATRSAFYHWFEADWRLDIYDDLMLKTLARIADDPVGLLPSSRWLSDRYLRDISRYAGDSFLIKGDGRMLMSAFGIDWLVSGKQARLDIILGRATLPKGDVAHGGPPMEGTSGLSASSSGPIHLKPTP